MAVIQYKCPNCGGPLQFDPESGKYTCEYCRGVFTQEELDEQTAKEEAKAAQSGEVKPEANQNEAAKGDDAKAGDAVVYTCPSCGATIVTDSTTAATFCYYCHNPVVLSGRLEGDYKPDYIVPFKIDKKKALEIFDEWIKKKKYVPAAFYSKSQIEKLSGVYFPYLLYTCNIDGSIDATATKAEISQRGGIEYTDTGTYHVRRSGNMEVKHVLRNALQKANKKLAEAVLPFDMEGLKPFNMSYLSGFFAEKKDIEKESMEKEMREEVQNYAVAKLKESVSAYDDVTITANNTKLVNEKWEYALFPVWTLTYNDNGKVYYFSVNGQSGKTIGELPIDNKKLILTFLLIFVPFALILLALFYFVL